MSHTCDLSCCDVSLNVVVASMQMWSDPRDKQARYNAAMQELRTWRNAGIDPPAERVGGLMQSRPQTPAFGVEEAMIDPPGVYSAGTEDPSLLRRLLTVKSHSQSF